jgi:integrase/recombinase XerC
MNDEALVTQDGSTAALSVIKGASPAEVVVATFFAGRNERTLRAYRHDLDDFARFTGEASIVSAARRLFALSAFEANVLAINYRADLLNRRLQPASVNRRLAALRSLVKLGAALGIITWELTLKNERTTPYRDTRGPNTDSVRRLLLAISKRSDAQGVRDFALLRLLYDLALRRHEVETLDLEHVSLDRMTISVLRKGNRERSTLTVAPITASALERWIAVRGSAPGPLFKNFDRARKAEGHSLTGTSINRIVQAWGRRLGIALTAHKLRHAAITAALDATQGNVRAVARFSGHRKIETVLIYDDNRLDLGGEISRLIATAVDPQMSA